MAFKRKHANIWPNQYSCSDLGSRIFRENPFWKFCRKAVERSTAGNRNFIAEATRASLGILAEDDGQQKYARFQFLSSLTHPMLSTDIISILNVRHYSLGDVAFRFEFRSTEALFCLWPSDSLNCVQICEREVYVACLIGAKSRGRMIVSVSFEFHEVRGELVHLPPLVLLFG